MAFVELFVVALVPVLKTLIISAIGLFLALERVNLLGSTARHHLNNLVFYIFTPALVASSLAETVTSSNIVSLWFMPVNILLTFVIGSALGWILVKITKTPIEFHGLVISCCAAGNLGNLLLIIIPAVCEEKNSPFGDSIACSTNGKAYASLSTAERCIFGHISITSFEILELNIIPQLPTLRILGKSQNYCPKAVHLPKMAYRRIWTMKLNLQYHSLDVKPHMMIREATIPAMTLIVGANLLRGLKKSAVGMWVVIGIQVIRYLALPLSGICVVKAARHFGLVRSDSLYQFVLLLQYARPSAMTIGTITQLFEVGESECSVIMLWNYALASVALTLWTTYYLWILS